jgi:hypothetical protein
MFLPRVGIAGYYLCRGAFIFARVLIFGPRVGSTGFFFSLRVAEIIFVRVFIRVTRERVPDIYFC